ncbi:MAG: hypothetical protein IT482_01480 [Gammaproteobacteria bacterium]|nr:hypothetical protein [Gammaproteobacteria bacterium]
MNIRTAIAVAVLAASSAAAVVQGAQPPRAAQWTQLASLPDWTGIWEVDWANKRGIRTPRPQMKLTPDYQKKLDAFRAAQKQGENVQSEAANCVPPGLPGIMTQPYPIEFLYQPGKVVMLIEAYMQFRTVHTDGRKHPEDPDLTYMGHSIGHWEGDTLVIDSVGFTTSTQIASGVPHSDQLRVVERIRRVSPDWMEIQTTLTDPVVLAEPYTITTSYRHLTDELREYICLENNRDGADEKGRPSLNLE